MTTAIKIRLAFIGALWLALCWLLVASQPFTLRIAFTLVASAIIVWVPLYKKYIKNGSNHDNSTPGGER